MEGRFERPWTLATENYNSPLAEVVNLDDYLAMCPDDVYAPDKFDLDLLNHDFNWTTDPQTQRPIDSADCTESPSHAGSSPQTSLDGLDHGSTRTEQTLANQDIPLSSPISLPQSTPYAQSKSASPSDSPRTSPARRGKPSPRRAAHNRIEKRYRENLSNNFAALHHAIQPYYNNANHFPCHQRKQATRKMEILADAVQYIGELQNETMMLRKKMQSLRQTLLPDGIWKYTLSD